MHDKIYDAQYRATHKNEIKVRNQNYRTAHKDEIKARDRKYQVTHKKKINAYQRKYQAELRARFLDIYGHKCSCSCGCDESLDGFLTLGHLQNDGKEDRMNGGGSRGVFRRAIKHPDHTKYVTLCYNCNCGAAYADGGSCPRIALNGKSAEDV